MSTVVGPQTPTPPAEQDDPWRIGWRYVPREQADGQMRTDLVPLRPEDLLYPREDDFIVNSPVHDDVCTYLRNALFDRFAGRPGAVVLHDCRVDWGVPDVQPLGPDFTVFENVHAPWDRSRGTFEVATLGARLLLAIEVTSPTTRNVDLDDKVDLYFRAGVPFYAIVDPRPSPGGGWEIRLMGYRREAGNREYFRARLDERGRLWLDSVRLWLATEGQSVVCYDEQGRRLMDHVEAVRAAREAGTRADTAEARLKELEAELQRLRGENMGGGANAAPETEARS